MGKTTGIAWTQSSWSPWIGCTKVSPGCDICYAEALDKRHRYGGATHWGASVPRYRTKSWDQPLAWNRKAAKSGERWTVFPSLCDPFDNEVPEQWRADFLALICDTQALTWLLLTKRIGNVAKMLEGTVLPNVWIGASVVNQEEADRDIPKLLAVPAEKRFVSYEPALGPIDFLPWMAHEYDGRPGSGDKCAVCGVLTNGKHHPYAIGIDWLIVGGESPQGGAKARPFDLGWARGTLAQCRATGVVPFIKQLGGRPTQWLTAGPHDPFRLNDRHGADPAEWPEDLRVQEFPAVKRAPMTMNWMRGTEGLSVKQEGER